jgi:lambda repressor-like predicted transcriptional regulator
MALHEMHPHKITHVEACKTSGLSQKSYCRQNDLKYSTFKNWTSRYNFLQTEKCIQSATFSKIVVDASSDFTPHHQTTPTIRIEINQVSVHVPSGVDASLLQMVMSVLSASL